MAKKTNIELYKHAQVKWDKANQPHQNASDFQKRYQEARLEWMKLKWKDFETTEAARNDLRPFIREKDFGNVRVVNFSEIPNKMFITAVHGNFSFSCNGKTTTYTLPIVPRSIDNFNGSTTDPFNQPDDTEPVYIERNIGSGTYIEVQSTTVPQALTVHYIKEPNPFSLVSSPNGTTEEEEAQQYEIVDIAIRKYELSNENYQRFQAMGQEISQSGT